MKFKYVDILGNTTIRNIGLVIGDQCYTTYTYTRKCVGSAKKIHDI